jgi:hypothetical protein
MNESPILYLLRVLSWVYQMPVWFGNIYLLFRNLVREFGVRD